MRTVRGSQSARITRDSCSKFAIFRLCILAAVLAFPKAADAGNPSTIQAPGEYTLNLNHDHRERSAIVHIPPRASLRDRLPVVVNFHGGGGHAANQQAYSLMDRIADREGFVAVYPNGTGPLRYRLLTWNAGSCCGYAAANRVDDVGFVIVLLQRLGELIPIDRSRIYATGLSNGAMMAYRLASEASQHFSAIAPVAGAMVIDKILAPRPVPVMHFHSVDDPRALYGGGLGPPFPLTNSRVFHPKVDDVIARWVEHNGCARDGSMVARRARGSVPEHTATRFDFQRCRDGSEVVLWKLTGPGHVWPGGKPKYLPKLLGPSTDVIDANSEMWNFFSRFRLKGV